MLRLILRGAAMPFIGLVGLVINVAVLLLQALVIVAGLLTVCSLATYHWISPNPAMLTTAAAAAVSTVVGCALLRPAQHYLAGWLWRRTMSKQR